MLPSTRSLTSRRGWLAAGAVICFFAFATPASAGPLCVAENAIADVSGSACRDFEPGDNAKWYLFDAGSGFDHLLRITVTEVLQPFGLRIVRNLVAPGPIPGFPEYNCVPYGPAGMCVEYKTRDVVNPALEYHPEEGLDYEGPIFWLASWILPIGIDPIPEIFHDQGVDDGLYDELLEGTFFSAELGPYDFTCDEPDSGEGANVCEFSERLAKFGDPVRVALSDSFSAVQVGQLAAPEPATTALFALIGVGMAVRQRRRR